MYLAQLLRTNPLAGISLCVCMATILWCILLIHRHKMGPDRLLMGLIGLISVYEGLRVLKEAGILALDGMRGMNGFVELTVCGMYLIAVLILRLSSVDRTQTRVKLRLVEANELTGTGRVPPTGTAEGFEDSLLDVAPVAMFVVDGNGLVSFWNASAERAFGWTRAEVLGKPLPRIVERRDGRMEYQDREGRRLPLMAWDAPVHGKSGVGGTLTVAANVGEPESGAQTVFKPAQGMLPVAVSNRGLTLGA